MASPLRIAQPFSQAHKIYVQRLYRKALKQSLDWIVFRDIWRQKAIEIRVKFERNRDVRDPRAVTKLLKEAEEEIAKFEHPDPYRSPLAADGTKWERNIPPPIFSEEDRQKAREAFLGPRGLPV